MAETATSRTRSRYRRLKTHAHALARRAAEHSEVAGVVFLGGLARGILDQYSDLDIVVLLSERNPKLKVELEAMGREESERLGVDIDLEVHSLRGFERLKRDDNRRWECSLAEVVYDKDGRTADLLARIVHVPDTFWTDRIVGDWAYFQWQVANPDAPKSVAEICMERGDRAGAHYSVNYGVDILVELLYALNREFLPPPKWRMTRLKGLEWRPRRLESILNEAMVVRDTGPEDLERRLRAMRRLHGPLERKVREVTGLNDEAFWKRFLKVFVFEE